MWAICVLWVLLAAASPAGDPIDPPQVKYCKKPRPPASCVGVLWLQGPVYVAVEVDCNGSLSFGYFHLNKTGPNRVNLTCDSHYVHDGDLLTYDYEPLARILTVQFGGEPITMSPMPPMQTCPC
ncbi:hypothetical protein FOZ63_007342 [Perkinsus olseni]|uniref:Uncharacterized protein n=1 Tax=Perkinsus olseni TaxID=32597 RepID=A0A7J6UCI1_PEROL|nr:hypothetical protein FOZ63_007342 [Perkinsus olseni]